MITARVSSVLPAFSSAALALLVLFPLPPTASAAPRRDAAQRLQNDINREAKERLRRVEYQRQQEKAQRETKDREQRKAQERARREAQDHARQQAAIESAKSPAKPAIIKGPTPGPTKMPQSR